MIDVPDLQILCLEIGYGCNLSPVHEKCPAHLGTQRYGRQDKIMDDHTILEVVSEFYRRGFKGYVGWHYYVEPLLYIERMSGLMARIRHHHPEARFILWTNGTLIQNDPEKLPRFDECWITNYGPANPPANIHVARARCNRVNVFTGKLDARRQPLGEESDATCQRPYTEFIVDTFGSVHLCCIDWRNLAYPGNVLSDGIAACIDKWKAMANAIVADPMDKAAPRACRCCPMRYKERSTFA